MKKLLTLLLIVPCLAFAQPKQKPGVTYDAVITRVIDGDTVGIAVKHEDGNTAHTIQILEKIYFP